MKRKKFDGKLVAQKSRIANAYDIFNEISLLKFKVFDSGFKSKIKFLVKHPKIYKAIFGNPYPKKIEQISGRPKLYNTNNIGSELVWDAFCLDIHRERILQFIDYKNKYSLYCLNGNFTEAEKLLDEIEDVFGVSLWLIRNRITIAKQIGGIKGEKDYTNQLLEKEGLAEIIGFLIQYSSLRNTNEISLDRFRKYFDLFLDKARKINLDKELCDFLIFEVLQEVDESEKAYTRISFWNTGGGLPIIDRYNSFTRLFANYNHTCFADKKVIDKVTDILKPFYFVEYIGSSPQNLTTKVIKYYENLFSDDLGNKTEILEYFSDSNNDWQFFFLVANIIDDEDLVFLKDKLPKFKYELIYNIFNCIQRNDKAQTSRDELLILSSIFVTLEWGDKIKEFVKKISSSSFYHDPNYRKTLSFYEFDTKNEFVINSHSHFLRGFSKIDFIGNINKSIANVSKELIPIDIISNSSKYLIESLINYKKSNINLALENIDLVSFDKHSFLSVFQFKLIIACQLESKEFNKLLNFTIDSFLENENYRQLIPYEYILKTVFENIEDLSKSISFPIFLYLNYQENGSIELLKEGYEDFMCHHGINRPSELIDRLVEFDIKKAYYFLEFVCVPEVIEIDVINFQSSEEISMERISICRKLNEIIDDKQNIYIDEINSLTQKTMINASLHSIEKSKIYVDIEGVKKLATSKYKDDYSKYTYLLETQDYSSKTTEDDLLTLHEDEDEGLSFLTPTNMIDHQFLLNFINIRNIFTSNSVHGLDVALSCDVRHGILSGAIRGKIVEQNLITNKDESEYQKNDFWIERLDYLEYTDLDHITSSLNKFSNKIDTHIEFINEEIMQIKIDSTNPRGKFDFLAVLDERFDEYKMRVNQVKTFEEYLEITIDHLWSLTDSSLFEIRKYLKGDCKNKFYQLIDELINDLEEIQNGNDLEELISSIIELRTILSTELNQISNWFTRSKSSNTPDYKIPFLINLAEVMINNNYPDIYINITKNINCDGLKFKGKTLKNLSAILFIILTNAIKHGKLSSYDININVDSISDNINFSIINNISPEKNYKKLSNTLNEKIIDLSKYVDSSITKKEGGSGFFKIAKILKNDLKSDYKLSASFIDEKTFETTLNINSKEIVL